MAAARGVVGRIPVGGNPVDVYADVLEEGQMPEEARVQSQVGRWRIAPDQGAFDSLVIDQEQDAAVPNDVTQRAERHDWRESLGHDDLGLAWLPMGLLAGRWGMRPEVHLPGDQAQVYPAASQLGVGFESPGVRGATVREQQAL